MYLSEEEEHKYTQDFLNNFIDLKLLQEQSKEERIYSDLLRLKYQMEDLWDLQEEKSFGKCL